MQEETESIAISNKAKHSVSNEIMRNFSQSNSQDLRTLLKTMRREKDKFKFFSQKSNSKVITCGIPSSLYIVSDTNILQENLVESNNFISLITMESETKP